MHKKYLYRGAMTYLYYIVFTYYYGSIESVGSLIYFLYFSASVFYQICE